MPAIVRQFKKQNILIISLRNNQNMKKPKVILVAMANIIIYNLIKISLDQYKYFLVLVKISFTNFMLFTKYALKLIKYFSTI